MGIVAKVKQWLRPVKWIIIHHIGDMPMNFDESRAVEIVRAWHKAKGWADIAYHKVILSTGLIKQGRADSVIGAHAFGANQYSLGILMVGDFRKKAPTIEQMDALVHACAILCKRYNVPVSKIIGHRDVARLFPGGASSDCPGDVLYDMISSQSFKSQVYAEMQRL